jgi:flagellar biosynthesis/type III secretory pathway chaperone
MNIIHLECLSSFITPNVLQDLLKTQSELLQSLNKCRGQVYTQMFEVMEKVVFYKLCQNHSVRDVWENYLSRHGFVPPCIKQHLVSNDRFGYNVNNEWVEWGNVNLTAVRLYWKQLFSGSSQKHMTKLNGLCKNIISTLPGLKQSCQTCGWACPQSEMYNQDLCSFCEFSKNYSQASYCLHQNRIMTNCKKCVAM